MAFGANTEYTLEMTDKIPIFITPHGLLLRLELAVLYNGDGPTDNDRTLRFELCQGSSRQQSGAV